MGVNTQQNDYYESLFRRTTASYRAKIDPENDKRDQCKRKSFETNKPIGSRQAAAEKQKVLSERNHGERSTSRDVLDWAQKSANQIHSRSLKSPTEKKAEEIKINGTPIKSLIEKTLTQVLHEKYSQEFVERDQNNLKEKTPIKFLVEQALKEKLTNFPRSSKERLNSFDPESLRSIIEDIVQQVLKEKLDILQKERNKSMVQNDDLENLNLDLKQKLNVSKEPITRLPREPVTHYNSNKSMDSQAIVQQLLAYGDKSDNVSNKNSKANKENSTTLPPACGIKRLQRISRKKPEWQDPSLQDNILDKPQKPLRSRSPVASLSARSRRSKCNSSVLSKFQHFFTHATPSYNSN